MQVQMHGTWDYSGAAKERTAGLFAGTSLEKYISKEVPDDESSGEDGARGGSS